MPRTVSASLDARIQAGTAQPDAAQHAAAVKLDQLVTELRSWRSARRWSLPLRFGGRGPAAPRGLYIWGKVGRGKTMLMDLFYETVRFKPKRRVHFHAFMAEVHDRINNARDRHPGDPIPIVAKEIADSARLLCFDEFHVTDIADAMILGRLFTALFDRHVCVVATSNVPPGALYTGGLNRELFLPFIALLSKKTETVELAASKDFRHEVMAGHALYFSPLGPAADAAMRAAFTRLSGQAKGTPRDLDVKGHKVHVPEFANGVALFSFADLCMKPLGPIDYLAISQAFHTILLAGIPRLGPERRAEARRLVALVDTLYDAHTGLIVSADSEPDDIYPLGDEAFLFERTASRLMEMRSEVYLKARPTADSITEPQPALT
jgi:cell division protein ZapE